MSNKSKGLAAMLFAFLLCADNNAFGQNAGQKPKYQEGIHYTLIENAPVASGDKVSLTEAFSYMCTHCATFEPYITSWQERKPDYVEFKRIPVVFGRGSWELYARAYVTAEVMGIANKAHAALMDKIWKEKDVSRDIEQLGEFYSAYGVKAGEFVATSKSFAVDAKMRKDQRTVQDAGVSGTPSLIVAGKYVVAGSEAVPNYDVMLSVVDFLTAMEFAARKPATPASAAAEESAPATDGER
jgi:protein dithiol oxidoreductase (disulfide-forming)